MPELPEVETVARQLHRQLRGLKLVSLSICDAKLRGLNSRKLHGRAVARVFRVGKQVVIEFRPSGSWYLAVHLRMTGGLRWLGACTFDSRKLMVRASGEDNKLPCRARLTFDKGRLLFEDVRRFGTMRLVRSLEDLETGGIEPLSPDFTDLWLTDQLAKSKQSIKSWLLRQDRLVGIGNIYASEILFRAGVKPQRRCWKVSKAEAQLIHRATRKVLAEAIQRNGTTFSDYRDSRGENGSFQRFLRVYGRDGRRCRRCAATVERLVQNGRSSFYCPGCQS